MIEVINPGLFTTVQDYGRWGYQAFGVSVAGVMDRLAYKTANLLLDNDEQAAVLEFTMLGGEYKFLTNSWIALSGADMEARLNGNILQNWAVSKVQANDILTLGWTQAGCRAYLAVAGGYDLPKVLGSRATHTRSKLGGLEGRILKKDDRIAFLGQEREKNIAALCLPPEMIPIQTTDIELRVLLGPQEMDFTLRGRNTFFNSIYTVTAEADRMGYRLEGAVVEHATQPDIVSDALCQGAIQIPGQGKPIIMMADRQTTGGYTKLGSVIGSDLRLLAQAKPGDAINFVEVTDAQAVAALQQEENFYRELKQFINKTKQVAPYKIYQINIAGKNYSVTVQEKKLEG